MATQPAEIPSYREQLNQQIKDMKIDDTNRFSPNRMPLFSPFQVTSHRVLHTTSKKKDGKGLFDSTSHLIVVSPKANPKAEITFVIFDEDYEKIRAITSLYPPRPFISVTQDVSTKPKTLIFSYHSSPA